MYHIKISKKTLEFNDVEVDEKNVHVSKRPIALNSVRINKTVAPDKFEHIDKLLKYFIGYKEYDIIRSLCIVLPQMSAYIKYFNNRGINMSFKIEDDNVLVKYNEIRNRILKIAKHERS